MVTVAMLPIFAESSVLIQLAGHCQLLLNCLLSVSCKLFDKLLESLAQFYWVLTTNILGDFTANRKGSSL